MSKLAQKITDLRSFFSEVKQELYKCSWPVRNELVESTWVVIVSVVILGSFVSLSDVSLYWVLSLLTFV